ncbi:MAG: single-stranded-DNA-specific exonuclease RecJ [Thermomicrobiales bacterium]
MLSCLIWIDAEPLPADLLMLHADPLIAELLYRRGIRDEAAASAFLRKGPSPAPDLSRMPNLDAAAERVCRAIEAGERIAIFGDYDADGVTSTALLVRALHAASGDPSRVIARVPTRDEGYGLNQAAIDDFAEAGASLLIAVDCGSSDHERVAQARSAGLDVVILDHHHMHDAGPAGAVVVSAQLDEDGSYRELAAVGVAYLLVAALAQHGCPVDGENGDPETALLDYVALGTVADVAPLTGANRAMVRDGLRRMRRAPREGVKALCRKAGLDPATLTAEQVSFKIAPRLNAAGRMADPQLALDLLLTDDPLQAATLADEIERLNGARRAESQRIVREAEQLIEAQADRDRRRLLIVRGTGWSSGVLGIAANQLVSRFGRPVIVLNDDGAQSRGSARSVPGFDIVEALTGCAGLLQAHGGHSQAAGLTVVNTNVAALTTALEDALDASGVETPIRPSLRLDAELASDRLTIETARLLEALQPFGMGNEQPIFLIRNLRVRQYDVMGQDRSHLRLHLAGTRGVTRAVSWGAAERSRELLTCRAIDVAATLGVDSWNGQTRLHVEVKDFRPASQ